MRSRLNDPAVTGPAAHPLRRPRRWPDGGGGCRGVTFCGRTRPTPAFPRYTRTPLPVRYVNHIYIYCADLTGRGVCVSVKRWAHREAD